MIKDFFDKNVITIANISYYFITVVYIFIYTIEYDNYLYTLYIISYLVSFILYFRYKNRDLLLSLAFLVLTIFFYTDSKEMYGIRIAQLIFVNLLVAIIYRHIKVLGFNSLNSDGHS